MRKFKKYLLKNLIAWDIAICALIPKSKTRQTISGYLGSDFDGSIFELVVNKLFSRWSGDHCSEVSNKESSFIE